MNFTTNEKTHRLPVGGWNSGDLASTLHYLIPRLPRGRLQYVTQSPMSACLTRDARTRWCVGICTACARIAFAYSERRFIYTVFWVGPSDTPLRFPSSTLQLFISIVVILLIIIITLSSSSSSVLRYRYHHHHHHPAAFQRHCPRSSSHHHLHLPFFQLLAQPHIQSSV